MAQKTTHLPLTVQAFEQLHMLQEDIALMNPSNAKDNKWSCHWKSNDYASMQMYKVLKGPDGAHSIFKLVLKASSMLRHKVFFRLILHDRLNTRDLLCKKNFHMTSYNCLLCSDQFEETLCHIFWDCPFALQCWSSIVPSKKRGISFYDEVMLTMEMLPNELALDIIIMGC